MEDAWFCSKCISHVPILFDLVSIVFNSMDDEAWEIYLTTRHSES